MISQAGADEPHLPIWGDGALNAVLPLRGATAFRATLGAARARPPNFFAIVLQLVDIKYGGPPRSGGIKSIVQPGLSKYGRAFTGARSMGGRTPKEHVTRAK